MKNSQSSLFLYIIYKYFFAYMVALMILGTTKELNLEGGDLDSISEYKGLLILMGVFLVLQTVAHGYIFRATVNKEEIFFNNGQTIKWDNIEFVNRLHHMYILRTRDTKRYYLFPTERQPVRIFGDRVEYTDMDQIIKLKTAD